MRARSLSVSEVWKYECCTQLLSVLTLSLLLSKMRRARRPKPYPCSADEDSIVSVGAAGASTFDYEQKLPSELKEKGCLTISSAVALAVLRGEYKHAFDHVVIIDCRYDFEFLGKVRFVLISVALTLSYLVVTCSRRSHSQRPKHHHSRSAHAPIFQGTS